MGVDKNGSKVCMKVACLRGRENGKIETIGQTPIPNFQAPNKSQITNSKKCIGFRYCNLEFILNF
jgi:hypothetical protein